MALLHYLQGLYAGIFPGRHQADLMVYLLFFFSRQHFISLLASRILLLMLSDKPQYRFIQCLRVVHFNFMRGMRDRYAFFL